MEHKSPDLTFAIALAKHSATIFKKYFGNSHTDWKADNTPITHADNEINDLMIEQIAASYPNDAVYGEEASNTTVSDRIWVIDPVDGTQPFENGIPVCTIVIALAVTYDPMSGDMYYAERGKGAYKNEIRIHCNNSASFAKNYFATSSFHQAQFTSVGTLHDRIEDSKGKVFNFRSFTYSAMKVAEGKLSGAVLGVGRLFDTAAPALIVEEAGGKATDMHGGLLDYVNDSDGIVVTNGVMHSQFIEYVQR